MHVVPGGCHHARPVCEGDDFAQGGQAGTHLRNHRKQVTTAMLGLDQDAVRLGVAQQMAEFLGLEGRVGGDQNDACQRGAELGKHPLGAVRRADGDMLARGEAFQERAGNLFGSLKQVGVAPSPSRSWVRAAIDERRALAPVLGGGAQRVADRAIKNRLRPVSRGVRQPLLGDDAGDAHAGHVFHGLGFAAGMCTAPCLWPGGRRLPDLLPDQ